MDLKEEYNRLVALFVESAEGKPIDLNEIFKESLTFFEHLSNQLKNGTEDDKKQALMMMSDLYTRMLEQTKKICAKTGLSEEQLVSFAENPSNFSSEQWQSIQKAKDDMRHVGQDLAKAVGKLNPPKQVEEAPEGKQKQEEEKKPPHPKKPKKTDWLKP